MYKGGIRVQRDNKVETRTCPGLAPMMHIKCYAIIQYNPLKVPPSSLLRAFQPASSLPSGFYTYLRIVHGARYLFRLYQE